MGKHVTHYQLSFSPGFQQGIVRIYLEDGTFHDFTEQSPASMNAIVSILKNKPVFWNESWLYTDNEVLRD